MRKTARQSISHHHLQNQKLLRKQRLFYFVKIQPQGCASYFCVLAAPQARKTQSASYFAEPQNASCGAAALHHPTTEQKHTKGRNLRTYHAQKRRVTAKCFMRRSRASSSNHRNSTAKQQKCKIRVFSYSHSLGQVITASLVDISCDGVFSNVIGQTRKYSVY